MRFLPNYEEWERTLIPSSYGELNGQQRYYRISYGTAHWHTADPGNPHEVCIVFVQYGDELDYKKANIKMNYPCHILNHDFNVVLDEMNKLKEKFM